MKESPPGFDMPMGAMYWGRILWFASYVRYKVLMNGRVVRVATLEADLDSLYFLDFPLLRSVASSSIHRFP